YMDEAEYCDRLALIDGGRIVALGSPTELRTRFMEQAVLEVEALPLLESLEALQESDEVLDAAFFGQRLHVRVADPRSGAEAVRNALMARSAEVLSIEQVIPSLEDVFVALVRSKEGTR
ncbi:MAG: ATP-binding protein DrrA1-3 family domain-containing protein, partial [Thermodesulfobacteriota bacterium]